ncbi:MAG: DUF7573 domain-containing protein [Halorubrum sp.]
MPRDRSLDDFAAGDEVADSAPADADAADADSDAGDSAPDDVDPAVATSTWHADGAACDRCGERIERRWLDGGEFVCADCASW